MNNVRKRGVMHYIPCEVQQELELIKRDYHINDKNTAEAFRRMANNSRTVRGVHIGVGDFGKLLNTPMFIKIDKTKVTNQKKEKHYSLFEDVI